MDVERTKAVTEAKVELANAKEALCVLEGWASADRSAKRGAIEDCDCVQGELATTSAKLQVENGVLPDTFDHLKRHSSNVWRADTGGQEHLNYNLRIYIQKVFEQVKQSI